MTIVIHPNAAPLRHREPTATRPDIDPDLDAAVARERERKMHPVPQRVGSKPIGGL